MTVAVVDGGKLRGRAPAFEDQRSSGLAMVLGMVGRVRRRKERADVVQRVYDVKFGQLRRCDVGRDAHGPTERFGYAGKLKWTSARSLYMKSMQSYTLYTGLSKDTAQSRYNRLVPGPRVFQLIFAPQVPNRVIYGV